MAILRTKHVAIKGVGCGLPEKKISIFDVDKNGYFPDEVIQKMHQTTGVYYLYEADESKTASDLVFPVAEALINELNWEKESIDGLIFASETPDYIIPPTSCILQGRLGLPTKCVAWDIPSGCPGSINALTVASQMIETGMCKRVLALMGHTTRRTTSKEDRSLAYLMSDAAAVIALEYVESQKNMTVIVNADGKQYDKLIMPASGFRMPHSDETKKIYEDAFGNRKSAEHYHMDGKAIFDFAVKTIPGLINEIRDEHQWSDADVDYYLLHQPNAYMLKLIAKRAKLDGKKIPINVDKYGNCSVASISLLMHDLYEKGELCHKNLILSSFGGGLYWGAAAVSLEEVKCIMLDV